MDTDTLLSTESAVSLGRDKCVDLLAASVFRRLREGFGMFADHSALCLQVQRKYSPSWNNKRYVGELFLDH